MRWGEKNSQRSSLWLLAAWVVIGACASPQTSSVGPATTGDSTAPIGSRRIVAAIAGQPVGVSQATARATLAYTVPGGEFLEALANRGLVVVDDALNLQADLAEAVPSIDNGLWVLNPDGTMDTTWTIRRGASWHDGTPLTADDLLFTAQVREDNAVPGLRDRAFDLVAAIDATDARTIVVHWKQPYYAADALFTAGPFPQHILGAPYASDKSSLLGLPYWGAEFIGGGPYRLVDWQEGSRAVFQAFDGYPLGRPQIDEVEVRFIPDPNTVIANVLAGTVDLAVGRDFSIEQAMQIAPQWDAGRPEIVLGGWVVIFPQFMNPTPSVVADPRFRQALTYALDRTQMATTIQHGQVPIANSFFPVNTPEYADAEQAAVHYDYDPRKAIQLIEDLGYVRDADGSFRDNANQQLTVPIWTSGGLDEQVKATLSVADYWKQVGIDAEPVVIPTQRASDREYLANFPAFVLHQQSVGRAFMPNLLSSAAPLAENQYVGANYSRYRNPELDALINRFTITVRPEDRSPIVQQMVRLTTEQAVLIGLYSNATAILVANRIHGVTGEKPGWNIHLWNVA